MTTSLPAKDLATECRHSFHQDWSPPALLLELASDDDGLIADLIDTFSTSTDARIKQIREALAALNFAKIRAEAHTIKGGARQVGADAVAQACQELEIVSDLQEAMLVAARLDLVQERFEETRSAMAAYSSRREMGPYKCL
jgi:HPt (histidine-containing phosphotransfer) domain-containing protein